MGFELTIQGLSQVGRQGTPGRNRANPESGQGRRRAFNPEGAKTPKDALAHIELLYKTGRIGEVAALLRHSQAYRMAWQTLQLSSSPDSGAGELASLIRAGASIQAQSGGLPVPHPGSGPDGQPQGQAPAVLPVTAAPESSPEIPQAQNYPVPASKPTQSLAAGRRAYETLTAFFARERAGFPWFNLRV
ncbi:MAG: hypothetical protein C4567_11295 [Deltaproteobacteria bacterium]|nr:MAG: hypothetical protein C4567_11295 [Deltaproteobacteria bacterium]